MKRRPGIATDETLMRIGMIDRRPLHRRVMIARVITIIRAVSAQTNAKRSRNGRS